MSFLLDAIRKAEKQRNEDTVPSLEAIVSERRQNSKNRQGRLLIWIALAMVIAATAYLNRGQFSAWWQKAEDVSKQGLASAKSSLGGVISIEKTDSGSNDPVGGKEPVDSNNTSTSEQLPAASSGSQLTDAQRALLSQIEFSVISYSSDPDKRFAMVGAEILREGDRLEGFRIKRIQTDGVVINVNGKSVLIRP